jgi:hypothetical protein
MTIFVVIIEDRHSDVEVLAYTGRDDAIKMARKTAKKYCCFEDSYEEDESAEHFYATYSCEGDSVRVEEVELNA